MLNPRSLMDNLPSSYYKIIRFVFYTSMIFSAHIASSILTQKIYKTKYPTNDKSSEDYFSHILAIPLVNSFLGMFYGFLKYEIAMRGVHHEQQNPVPYNKYLRLGGVQVCILLLGNWAITLSSFTTYNLIHCCSFLSVVLFAVFFSRVRDDRMHIGKSKIYISILVCFGIFLFNAYTSNNETDNINKPLTVFSFLVILTLLIFEGYRPDIQAQIRSEFHPSPSLLFYSVATIIFLTMLAISIVTLDLFKICAFVWNHDTLAKDLMVHGCLGVFGDIFVYRLLLLHRQHIVPLISTIRRITTSMVNILWFHHTITFGQYIGIAIICIGIFLELFSNYLQQIGKDRSEKVKNQEADQDLEDTI